MTKQILILLLWANVLSPFLIKAQNNSAYIYRVFDYRPAPGQYTNVLPAYEDGDTEESMAQKAEDCLANHKQTMISLGGYGGYVVFGFDHKIQNISGKYDFTILGNAFYSNSNPNSSASKEGGSSEPGIVMVSRDDNNNGLPDDKWYELAGSEYYKTTTRHNYTITYHRTPADHVATPSPTSKVLIDTSFVAWETSVGGSGHIYKNSFHRQNYYPNWLKEDEMSFTGTLLPNNAVDESGKGSYFVLYCYGYGYVDNHPNTDAQNRSKFNIEWAVDEEGNTVYLDGINFVKVYTALNQYVGQLGETSTEVMDAWDLHMLGGDDEDTYYKSTPTTLTSIIKSSTKEIYSLSGQRLNNTSHPGIYIIRENGVSRKIMIK